MIRAPKPAAAEIAYAAEIETAIAEVRKLPGVAQPGAKGAAADARYAALACLEDPEGARRILPRASFEVLLRISAEAEAALGDTLDILLADGRYGFIAEAAAAAVTHRGRIGAAATVRIDRVVLHRALGLPIFLLVMYAMFLFTMNIGGAFIDFFDQAFGAVFVDGFGLLLAGWGAPEWLVTLLADGVGGGIQTVATFVPVIGCLFLFLSFLEDSGYMARAAFVMDRVMRAIGLPGKAFVPLIVGFGCSVPAGDGRAHPGKPARPRPHRDDGAVHVVRRAAAGLRSLRRRVLPHQRTEPGVRALPHRHRRGDRHRLHAEEHPAARRDHALHHGTAALPHAAHRQPAVARLGPA